jgi:hypothetical protein
MRNYEPPYCLAVFILVLLSPSKMQVFFSELHLTPEICIRGETPNFTFIVYNKIKFVSLYIF